MEIKRVKLSVMDVYSMVLKQAQEYREEADRLRNAKKLGEELHVFEAMSRELYEVAANLEMTKEINPAGLPDDDE